MPAAPDDLVHLAHALATPERELCILAEGNVSARADEETFWVKGSGHMMGAICADGFSRIRLGSIWAALHQKYGSDEEIRQTLDSALIEGPSPSTETFMHAVLLSMPGVRYVGHVHPTPLLSILCLDQAESWATKRLFPDEIVFCGLASCFIPYVAPGLALAQEIQRRSEDFERRYGAYPKTIWLQNHGLIAIGATANEVESACLMSVKSARVLLGALQTGNDIHWLTDEEIAHIHHWPDEHARQKALWGSRGDE